MNEKFTRQMKDGIISIKDQHRQVYTYAEKVEKMVNAEYCDLDALRQVMDGLIDYCNTCFGYEDALMEMSGYPMVDDHQRSHRTFLRRVEGFREEALKGRDMTKELMSILRIWMLAHIEGQDNEFITTLQHLLAGSSKASVSFA